MLAPPKWKIVNGVESNAVGRYGNVVEVGELQPLLVAKVKVWLTEQLDVFWDGRPAALTKLAVPGATVDRGVSSGETAGIRGGQGSYVGVKPLEAQAISEFPAEFNLRRMIVRIARVVDADQSPPRYRPQEIGLAGRLEPGPHCIAVLRLLVVDGELLLEVLTIRPDIAQPQSRVPGQFVFQRDVPGLLALVVPVGTIPNRRSIAKARKALRGVDIHRGGGKVI